MSISRPFVVLLIVSFAGVVFDSSQASAQPRELELVEEPDPVARAQGWLDLDLHRLRRQRRMAGGLSISVGALSIGIGSWFFLRADGSAQLPPQYRYTFGALYVATGALSLGLGVLRLAQRSAFEQFADQFERWREGGLTEYERGRMEGEFSSLAESARMFRHVQMTTGFALAFGGGLVSLLGAVGRFEGDLRSNSYRLGGMLGATGFLFGILSLIRSPIEKAWSEYERGFMPAPADTTITAAPTVSSDGAGLVVSGAF